MRSLSNTPLQLDVTFLTTVTYVGKNTATSHLDTFYLTYEDVKDQKFDGLIITGAPVETMEFEDVAYWEELKQIMDWSETNVTSTLHICWGAQAGLHHHYGVRKLDLSEKLSGVYRHEVYHRREPLVRGFDDVFYAPHSRYTEMSKEDILANDKLQVLADSKEAGIFLVLAEEGKNIFVLGHPEYDRITLDKEYKRDVNKGINPALPVNYYPNDNCEEKPLMLWRAHANTLYTNWVNYYVYQKTPYEW
jgi:homoserine O-succinyltransferase